MDDDDYEDLLGEDDQDVPIPEEDPMGDSSSAAIIPDMPSANELRLGRRVADLEAERTQLLAEIEGLRKREVASPTVPAATDSPPTAQPIVVPHDLLPTLQVLRTHIGGLTRENAALRYTFIGRNQQASSSKVKLDDSTVEGAEAVPGGVQGIDLGRVIERVKDLQRENEELGEMVLEAGRAGAEEYEKTMSDTRKVIESLESDLDLHSRTVQSLRSEISAYRSHFGPLPNSSGATPSGNHSRSDRPRDRERDRERDRPSERRHQDSPRSAPIQQDQGLAIRGMSNQSRQSIGNTEKRDDRRPDTGRQDRPPGQSGGRGDDRRDERGGGRRRDDDRGSKRRR